MEEQSTHPSVEDDSAPDALDSEVVEEQEEQIADEVAEESGD